jgi:hypothetical protein
MSGYAGHADFHDGHIVALSHRADHAQVVVEGHSGRRYRLRFAGATSVESESAEGMTLYALREDADGPTLRRYTFVNWFADESDDLRSQAFLNIVAERFAVEEFS